jgi:hypothetical protein
LQYRFIAAIRYSFANTQFASARIKASKHFWFFTSHIETVFARTKKVIVGQFCGVKNELAFAYGKSHRQLLVCPTSQHAPSF